MRINSPTSSTDHLTKYDCSSCSIALPLSTVGPLTDVADDFLFVASSLLFARIGPLQLVLGALLAPFVVTDDDEDDGDGNDAVGDGVSSVSFVSLLTCNLCSPFCSDNDVGTFAAAFAHDFEQYGFFFSFPFTSADFPQ